MKTNYQVLLLVLAMVVIASCSSDNELDSKLNVTEATLQIEVADEDGQTISAQARIVENKNIRTEFALSDGLNQVPLKLADNIITLKVEKEGFEPYELDLSSHSAYLSTTKVLRIVLKSLVAFTIDTQVDDDVFSIQLEGRGTISVLWPDGTKEESAMPLSFSKEFDAGSNRPIILKGDISRITSFYTFGYNTSTENLLGLRNMKSLEMFLPGNFVSSNQLDLTHNRKLRTVDLFNASLPRWIKLPPRHDINSFTLSLSDRNINAQEVAQLIDNIYKNSVKRKITNGWVALTGSDPALAKTVNQIEELESKYSWRVELNY
jgi:hypothetical protein